MSGLMNRVKARFTTSEKNILRMCLIQTKNNKKHSVIIKQFKNINNTKNSFFRERTDSRRHICKNKRLVIATTTKHKSYGMKLVVTENKLTFL